MAHDAIHLTIYSRNGGDLHSRYLRNDGGEDEYLKLIFILGLICDVRVLMTNNGGVPVSIWFLKSFLWL